VAVFAGDRRITKACENWTRRLRRNVSFYNETWARNLSDSRIGVVEFSKMCIRPRKCTSRKLEEQSFAARESPATRSMPRRSLVVGIRERILERVGYPPELDLEKEATLQRALVAISRRAGRVRARLRRRRLSRALVESALPAGVGLSVRLPKQKLALEFVLFAEDASRVALTATPSTCRNPTSAEEYEVFADVLAKRAGSIEIRWTVPEISASVQELREAYEERGEGAETEPGAVAAD